MCASAAQKPDAKIKVPVPVVFHLVLLFYWCEIEGGTPVFKYVLPRRHTYTYTHIYIQIYQHPVFEDTRFTLLLKTLDLRCYRRNSTHVAVEDTRLKLLSRTPDPRCCRIHSTYGAL